MVVDDLHKEKANGEAMDLNHGLAFAKTNMRITAGEYKDCSDADIVVICAGVSQKPGEDRISLLQRNKAVFKSIISPVLYSGFDGIFLVATNPVDIMTRVAWQLSGFDSRRVLGSGTTLDTARLRYLLGEYFTVDPKNVHAYVIVDQGDFYGNGLSLVRIVKAIFGGENSILTVSAMLRGEYGISEVFAGVPCILGRDGIQEILTLNLEPEEEKQFQNSCALLDSVWHDSFYATQAKS